MWEYRLVWDSEPAWWKRALERGMDHIARTSESPEERPDLYLVLPDRVDIGLKLRGNSEFEVKILHQRSGGWELWEKIVIKEWNSLEAARFAGALRIAPAVKPPHKTTPIEGAEALLRDVGISVKHVEVQKKRIQATAGILLGDVEGSTIYPNWLAELVEIRLPGRPATLASLCLETLEPLRGGAEPAPHGDANCCSYPELLSRHVQGKL